MWGTSPLDYVAFAREAMVAPPAGRMLDAGCGSLLFTAQVYLASERQVIAFDQSLEMLKRARARLKELAGSVPKHILLLQADAIHKGRGPIYLAMTLVSVHEYKAQRHDNRHRVGPALSCAVYRQVSRVSQNSNFVPQRR